MRRPTALLILTLFLLLLAAPAVAASITDSTVTNTNIYAGSTTYNIGPAAEIDSTSTASGITSVSDRYLYASSLTNTLSAGLATYSINGRQGSTTISATQGTALGMDWTYGDGSTATTDSLKHIYNTPGTYTTTLELSNYLTTSDITLTTSVGVASSGVSDCTVTNTNIYAGSNNLPITPSAYDKGGNSVSGITTEAGRYVYAGTLEAAVEGTIATLTLNGKQGSTTISATQGTAQSWAWTFGDESTADTVDTTSHTYEAPGEYTATLTVKNYLDTTGSTAETLLDIFPIAPSISLSTNTLAQGGTVTLTADGDKWTDIQWQYSTNAGSTWQNIDGATTATYDWQPANGQYLIRAHVLATTTRFTVDSETVALGVYAPPTIVDVSITPVIGQYTETITLTAEITDTGTAPTTYQWQQSSQGLNSWQNIAGATTSMWVGQLTVSGPTDIRLLATGTGGTAISNTVTYYIALPGEIQSLTATPSVITLPGSTTLTATGSNVISWEWQQYTSGVWTPIGYSASVTERFTDTGTYQFRVLATGADGAVVTSETVEVIAGFAPSVSITSPNDGTRYQSGERIPLTATITGTDPTWEWSFGSQDVQTGGNSQTTWVEYGIDGRYTISIRVVSLFGTDEDSITIISGRESRPIATTPPIELESDGIFEATDSLTPNENGMPDITGFIMSMSKPFTDMIGAWFYFVLFAVPYLIIWIRQKNIIIPSILGVLFAAWVLIQLPAAALPAAIALITLSVTGGLYGIYVKLQNR